MKTENSNFRRDAIIPTLETHAQLYDGVRYDELPIVHIKATLNNTIMTLSNHNGKCVGLIFWWLMKLPHWFKVTFLPKILGILTTRGEKNNFGCCMCALR